MVHYDINDDELLNERNYGNDYNRGHLPQHHPHHHRHIDENDVVMHERDRDRERYPSGNQPPQLTRRDRDEYSPHRGAGNSRRVLNAM